MIVTLFLILVISTKWFGDIFFKPILEGAVMQISKYVSIPNAPEKHIIDMLIPVKNDLPNAKRFSSSWRDDVTGERSLFDFNSWQSAIVNNFAYLHSIFV